MIMTRSSTHPNKLSLSLKGIGRHGEEDGGEVDDKHSVRWLLHVQELNRAQ